MIATILAEAEQLVGWQFAALVISALVGILTALSIVGSAVWVVARTTTNTQNMMRAIDDLRSELKSYNLTQQKHESRLTKIESLIERIAS